MAKRAWKLATFPAALVVAAGGLLLTTPADVSATSAAAAPSSAAQIATNAPALTRAAHKAKKKKKCKKLTRKQRAELRRKGQLGKLRAKRCSSIMTSSHSSGSRAPGGSSTSPAPGTGGSTPAPGTGGSTPPQTGAPGSPTVFGMSANNETALRDAEAKIGVKAGVVGVFTDWNHSFPTAEASNAAARGASLLISWEPQDSYNASDSQPLFNLDRIRTGVFDGYIRSFAQAAAATGRPVFVRWAAEMNGDWQPWCEGINGNGNGDYAATYRYVVNVARAAGGTNIKWVFNPIVSYPGTIPLSELYPGDSYVDWVALDGYNWGSVKQWGWQSFADVFTMGLAEVKSVAPAKPLGIAEVGSAPGPGNKAAWVTDTMAKARAAGVRMLVWFEHNKETDWRLSSDPTVAAAAKTAVTQPGWVTGGDYNTVKSALGI